MIQKRKLTMAAAATAVIISTSATALCETQLRTKAPSVEPVMELKLNGNELKSLFDGGTGITMKTINDSITEMNENTNKNVTIKAEPVKMPKETAPKEVTVTTDTSRVVRENMKVGDVLEFKRLTIEMRGVSPVSLAICFLAQFGEEEWKFRLKEGESTELKAIDYDMEKTYLFDVKVEKLGYDAVSITPTVSIKLKSVN